MIDLKIMADDRYRIQLDESWSYEKPEIRKPDKRWYQQIPCQGEAIIYLFSENPVTLALWTPRVKNAGAISREVPGCKLDLMDGECVLYFPPEAIHQIAKLARARKKKQLSPEAKEKLGNQGREALKKYRSANVETPFPAQD